MRMRKLIPAIVGFFWVVLPSAATACPDCPAGIREQVRRGIYGEGFGFNLFATVLPFGVFLGVAAMIHSGFPSFPEPDPRRPDERH